MNIDKHRNANGTYNGVTTLAELSGICADEIRAIAEQVKANHAKLDACAYHEFAQLPYDQAGLSNKPMHICTNCQGEVDETRYRWHELGRRTKT